MPSTKTRRCAITCICRCNRDRSRVLDRMQRLYTRDEYMRRIEWMKNVEARYRHQHRHHRRISRRDRGGFPGRRSICWTRWSTIRCSASNTRKRPNTPALAVSKITFLKKKISAGLRSCRRGSGRSRFAAMPSTSAKCSEVHGRRIATKPPGSGSAALAATKP